MKVIKRITLITMIDCFFSLIILEKSSEKVVSGKDRFGLYKQTVFNDVIWL